MADDTPTPRHVARRRSRDPLGMNLPEEAYTQGLTAALILHRSGQEDLDYLIEAAIQGCAAAVAAQALRDAAKAVGGLNGLTDEAFVVRRWLNKRSDSLMVMGDYSFTAPRRD